MIVMFLDHTCSENCISFKFNQALKTLLIFWDNDTAFLEPGNIVYIVYHVKRVPGTLGNNMANLSVAAFLWWRVSKLHPV
jgi:hypothetical protein